jgi:hypothetical protein
MRSGSCDVRNLLICQGVAAAFLVVSAGLAAAQSSCGSSDCGTTTTSGAIGTQTGTTTPGTGGSQGGITTTGTSGSLGGSFCVPSNGYLACTHAASMGAQSLAAAGSAVDNTLTAITPDEFPTGRLRETWHDGLRIGEPGGGSTGSFKVSEAAIMGGKSVTVFQGTGDLKLGTFIGYSRLNADFGPSGKAGADAYFAGGSGTYTRGVSYVSYVVSGVVADAALSGAAQAAFGIYGAATSLSAGHTFDLKEAAAKEAGPLKLSLKAGLSYKYLRSEPFANNGVQMSSGLDGWNGSLSAKLFGEIEAGSGGLIRPYVSVGLNQQLSYDNYVSAGDMRLKYLQDDTLVLGEIGFDYSSQGMSFNGGVYGETARDRSAVGAKIGVKYLFN